jgi:hypothetical protein
MRAPVLPVLLLVATVGLASPTPAEGPQPAPNLAEAAAAYLRDPVGGASLLIEAARRHSGELNAVYLLLLSDAALRTGQTAVAKELTVDLQRSAADPGMASMAEAMLAWTALVRGRLLEASARLEAAGALNPGLRPITDVALGLVGSARGTRDGPILLATAATRPDIDPAWREIAPLLDAYARYWQGDAVGAAEAFTAFAVFNPGSRFTDDALYAAARAKRRAGRTAEADADLAALAGDGPTPTGVPRRLLALDPRALLRDGLQRDRGLGVRTLGQRFADLLDGDGVLLARAALAAGHRRHGAARDDAVAPGTLASAGDRRLDGAPTGPGVTATARPSNAAAGRGGASPSPRNQPAAHTEGDGDAPGTSRGGWRWLAVAAAALLLGLALRRLARRRPGAA